MIVFIYTLIMQVERKGLPEENLFIK